MSKADSALMPENGAGTPLSTCRPTLFVSNSTPFQLFRGVLNACLLLLCFAV